RAQGTRPDGPRGPERRREPAAGRFADGAGGLRPGRVTRRLRPPALAGGVHRPRPDGGVRAGRAIQCVWQAGAGVGGRPDGGGRGGEREPDPASITGDWGTLDRLRITPDGRTITSVADQTVRIWHRTRKGWHGPQLIPIPDYQFATLGMWLADGTRFSADSR